MTVFVFGAFVLPVTASGPIAPAKTLKGDACARATREKKNVMLIFHASWCGWCKKLDAMLESAEFKKTFESNYVITHVDVMESDTKKALENPGGMDLMTRYGGEKAGLPFFVILSPNDEKIGDSFLPNKQNMGYPGEPQEIAAFMTLMKKTAPRMTESQRSTLEAFLKAQGAQLTRH